MHPGPPGPALGEGGPLGAVSPAPWPNGSVAGLRGPVGNVAGLRGVGVWQRRAVALRVVPERCLGDRDTEPPTQCADGRVGGARHEAREPRADTEPPWLARGGQGAVRGGFLEEATPQTCRVVSGSPCQSGASRAGPGKPCAARN